MIKTVFDVTPLLVLFIPILVVSYFGLKGVRSSLKDIRHGFAARLVWIVVIVTVALRFMLLHPSEQNISCVESYGQSLTVVVELFAILAVFSAYQVFGYLVKTNWSRVRKILQGAFLIGLIVGSVTWAVIFGVMAGYKSPDYCGDHAESIF